MSNATRIEWTDATWNPVRGCTPEGFDLRLIPEQLELPLRWRKPRRVFVSSSDLFHKDVPVEFIMRVFVVMDMCQQHTFMILTKRPERMSKVCALHPWFGKAVPSAKGGKPHVCSRMVLPNVWLGVSVEDQRTADERIPLLLNCPAAIRFVSIEPMLGEINLASYRGRRIDWVIVGGESGPGARLMRPAWVRHVRDQCQASGVPFFFKQWDGVQKNGAGRMLDGRTYDEFPGEGSK